VRNISAAVFHSNTFHSYHKLQKVEEKDNLTFSFLFFFCMHLGYITFIKIDSKYI